MVSRLLWKVVLSIWNFVSLCHFHLPFRFTLYGFVLLCCPTNLACWLESIKGTKCTLISEFTGCRKFLDLMLKKLLGASKNMSGKIVGKLKFIMLDDFFYVVLYFFIVFNTSKTMKQFYFDFANFPFSIMDFFQVSSNLILCSSVKMFQLIS